MDKKYKCKNIGYEDFKYRIQVIRHAIKCNLIRLFYNIKPKNTKLQQKLRT